VAQAESPAEGGGLDRAAVLPERARELLDSPILGVLTTLYPDGSPHSTPVWVMREGDDVLISTITRRVKARNLSRDPRASVVLMDPEYAPRYFSISGSVELEPGEDGRVLSALSEKYLGASYPDENPDNVRVTIRLRPRRVIAQYEPAT
jgi:PPOX class probable F420-dependent enzyme